MSIEPNAIASARAGEPRRSRAAIAISAPPTTSSSAIPATEIASDSPTEYAGERWNDTHPPPNRNSRKSSTVDPSATTAPPCAMNSCTTSVTRDVISAISASRIDSHTSDVRPGTGLAVSLTMPAESAAEDTPRPKQRAFTDTTEDWFAAGDEISETPQNDVYAEEAP